VEAHIDTTGIYLVTDSTEKKEFLSFPYQLYNEQKLWIPPLMMEQKKLIDTQQNPFYDEADLALFVATLNGKTAGRIAAIHNKAYNRYHKTNIGFFGFFDCIDDQRVCNLLIKAVGDWFSERGITEVLGPTSPGMMDVIGYLTFDPATKQRKLQVQPTRRVWAKTRLQLPAELINPTFNDLMSAKEKISG
jgi:hypothetical protein